MEIGYRESKDSWADVLRSLRDRGLSEPLVFIADGSLGLWAALTDVFPTARRQRCWNQRLMNVMDKVPRRLQRIVRSRLYQLYTAPTQAECEASRDELAEWLREHAQVAAAETLLRDWNDFVTSYDFPTPHWFHLRTLCRYTASVTSSGGRLCPRIRLPGRVVQLHDVALSVKIPSTAWRCDATQLLERAGVVIGQRCSAIAARRSGPCLPSPR
jgi:transposase-like protein